MKSVVLTSAMLLAFPAAGQDWSGHWAGLSLGYGAGTYHQGDFEADQAGVDVDVDGPLVGLRYERNFQNGDHVFGFDVDLSNGVNGSRPQGTGASWWSCIVGDCAVDITAMLTLRGRYGWLLSPETMAYGAAGLAAGRAEGGILDSLQEGSSTAVGFTVGGGVSRMVGPNLQIFGEVNYVDLGTLHFGIGDSYDDVFDAKGDFATIKIGASFRF
ncbi:MAG: porin family protein [Tabrizicola sp.]|nr:porin family protein [Tabrizicola sp.]